MMDAGEGTGGADAAAEVKKGVHHVQAGEATPQVDEVEQPSPVSSPEPSLDQPATMQSETMELSAMVEDEGEQSAASDPLPHDMGETRQKSPPASISPTSEPTLATADGADESPLAGPSQYAEPPAPTARTSQDHMSKSIIDVLFTPRAQIPDQYTSAQCTEIELVSMTATSSAFAEPLSFSLSRKGTYIAAYCSTSLHIITVKELPDLQAQSFRIRRKPISVDVRDDGRFAVLWSHHQVDLYTRSACSGWQIQQTFQLSNDTSVISIEPEATVLAGGHTSGVELVSMRQDARSVDRREVVCDGPIDGLSFSENGKTLLISHFARRPYGSVLITVEPEFDGPIDDEGYPAGQTKEEAWLRNIFIPNKLRGLRQAVLVPDSFAGDAPELLAFDVNQDTYAAFDVSSVERNGVKVVLPESKRRTKAEMLQDCMPVVSSDMELAALAIYHDESSQILVFQRPFKQDEQWQSSNLPSELSSGIPALITTRIKRERETATLAFSKMRWVESTSNEDTSDYNSQLAYRRLVAVGASGDRLIPRPQVDDEEDNPIGASGQVILLDIDRSQYDGETCARPGVILQLRDVQDQPLLPEGSLSFEREVELVRTRTQMQRRRPRLATDLYDEDSMRRPMSSLGVPGRPMSTPHDFHRRSAQTPILRRRSSSADSSDPPIDEPYSQSAPRSHASLSRAATVAANSPANPSRTRLRALPQRPLEYRRADGIREMPDESDADNWVPPPPPYTADPVPGSRVVVPTVPTIPTAPAGYSNTPGGRYVPQPAPLSQPLHAPTPVRPSQQPMYSRSVRRDHSHRGSYRSHVPDADRSTAPRTEQQLTAPENRPRRHSSVRSVSSPSRMSTLPRWAEDTRDRRHGGDYSWRTDRRSSEPHVQRLRGRNGTEELPEGSRAKKKKPGMRCCVM